ncbi:MULTISPECIES: SbcC/MukB-like Walker B domain-containing protein [unclassified Microcoleus]|uniref:SbcC/MukB-like Walker B domain-containing protein n=1 Tax=unclassified Microcoleus TaxID=2642155 RepID=UPI002FD48DF9
MQILLPFEPIDNSPNALAGFRLQRFEALNWGTFDRRPWTVDLQGGIALLTGANGSGKSTLIDGLLTLLVPNKRRNYNQASSTSGKKERDEKSYVQGAYSRTRAEEKHGSKAKFLREKGTLSVLLAYFSDRASQQEVTLAQVLWMEEGSVRKFFVVADAELSIAAHFNCTRTSDLKKQLKAMGAETFDEFIKYSQQFRKRLGLQSEKALDLFNQTVSIKEIGGLNDFVRNHMLEKTDVQTKIGELQKSYKDLTESHAKIQKAGQQLEALKPLTEEAEKFQSLQNKVADIKQYQAILPSFFASKKMNLLTRELQIIDRQLTQTRHQRTENESLLENLRQQERNLDFAIKQDSVGQRIQELKREIEQCQKEVNNKKKQTDRYDSCAKLLNLPEYSERNTFYSSRTKGEGLKQEIEAALQTLEAQRDKQKLLYSDLQKEQTQLDDELKSLRKRRSQIPKSNLDIRDGLARSLNLNDTDLPFIGELLQVHEDAREWEGAIERLLRPFGLSILVPEAHYPAVNAYVNRTHLGGKLVYYRVTSIAPNPTQRALNPQQVPSKLEIKGDNQTFYHWLKDRLVRNFNYVCCDTEAQFQRETVAIMRTGLTKQGGERHEKDDRSKVGDRSQYILGWSNASKIQALETDLKQINHDLNEINKQIQFLEKQRHQRSQQASRLQDFMNFADFAEIDWRSKDLECLDFQKQLQELQASSDRLKQLETQLQTTKEEIIQADRERDGSIREIQRLEDRQSNALKQQNECEIKVQLFTTSDIEDFQKRMTAKLRQYSLTLETIDRDETNLRDFLQDELRQKERQQDSSRSSLTMQMLNFKNAFPETVLELGSSLDYLDEYLKLKLQIEHDDLPRYEKEFKRLMDEKIILDISMFKTSLDKQEEDIQQAIDELNESLHQINYTDSTYIKLCCDKTRNEEIKDFRNDLKVCLGDAARQSAEDNEERFQNIRTLLIERFKSEERWTNLVTDVRNWLDFSASERYGCDNSEKEHHTDSSGKSGGQKVKLAYTILASAIAYQFGLHQDTAKHKSFRFVVIDEAFSKSDDSNARYAMELFKNLNLQLLVVTPKDKINVIEPYISSLHFVTNTPEGDCSSITSMSIEEFRQNRQTVLNQNRDARSRSN